MIACLDVHYTNHDSGPCEAWAACVLLKSWTDSQPTAEFVEWIANVSPYEPGAFFRRELPCLLAVLRRIQPNPLELSLEAIVVDGHVWLDDSRLRPGLGARLHQALGGRVPIIGVAKTSFLTATAARELVRGSSQKPLFISSIGIHADCAVAAIQSMRGPYRIPDLIKRADQLCRQHPLPKTH